MDDKECKELSKMVIECSTNMEWIKERLEKGDMSFTLFNERVSKLEVDHSLLKGKLGAFVAGLTLIATLTVNGLIWVISHFRGKW